MGEPMKQIISTILFFVFMFLLVNMYISRANAQYYDYNQSLQMQQQLQQMQQQQQEMQNIQRQQDLQRTFDSNNRCFYVNGNGNCTY